MKGKKKFINSDFLLENRYARELYHEYAKPMPIIDYHCHLPPEDIANDHIFKNITEIWIHGDHYKWRAMRALGVNEKYITGDASDEEKFLKWAEIVPYTMRNPLYHWTHLELSRYFGIDELLDKKSAPEIFKEASKQLNSKSNSCQQLLKKMNVEVVCTTDDPSDTLEHHKKLAASSFKTKVGPAFRPDNAILIGNANFNAYIDKLASVVGISIDSYNDLCSALRNRIQYFSENGCTLSDHGLSFINFESFTETEIKNIFKKKREHKDLSLIECAKFESAILLFLSETYHDHWWVQQFHLGALRNNNSRMDALLGPNTGWDSIGDFQQAEKLSKFLNALDANNKLTKTILYNSNPNDNEVFAAMTGNFNDGSVKGKVQFGSGWWFLDQKDGIIDQLNALSNIGILSCFVGMLTDSRSFLSYPRHEYFRRILCNLFGEEIKKGLLPKDLKFIGKMIQDISYNNAKEYFKF